MSLETALAIANSGLADINLGLTVIGQNIANVGTPDWSAERAPSESADAGGMPLGVRSGPVLRASDPFLEAELQDGHASLGFATTRNAALGTLMPLLGTVGQSDDLNSRLGALSNAFSALLADPSNAAGQGSVVASAQTLAGGINTLASGYAQARQATEDQLSGSIDQLNASLTQLGTLNQQIVQLRASGQSTADLENTRAGVLTTLSGLVGIRTVPQTDGALLVFSAAGTQLPTDGAHPLSIAPVATSPSTFYPGGGIPGIMLGGADVTGALTGGKIGALVAMRDQTIPLYQGEIDEFSQNLAARFSAQGLDLFTDSTGAVPQKTGPLAQSGYVGFSNVITVNPAVVADPSLVRDGTVTGAGALNPQHLAGFTGLIENVLDYTFGADSSAGVPQMPGAVSGLGPAGNLAAPFAAGATLSEYGVALSSAQAADGAAAAGEVSHAQDIVSTLSSTLSSETGVSMDSEMSRMVALQNAYSANARVISTVQSMWSALLAAVQP